MPIQKIGRLLDGSLRRAGIRHKVSASQVIKETKKIIKRKWGEKALDKISPLYVKNKILTIKSKDSVYLAELKLKESELIKEINDKYKEAAVKELRLLVK